MQRNKLLNTIKKEDHNHLIILAAHSLEGSEVDMVSYNNNDTPSTFALIANYLWDKNLLEVFIESCKTSIKEKNNECKQSNVNGTLRQ